MGDVTRGRRRPDQTWPEIPRTLGHGYAPVDRSRAVYTGPMRFGTLEAAEQAFAEGRLTLEDLERAAERLIAEEDGAGAYPGA